MKISLLQPKIQRGNIKNNISHIQNLINKSKGDLLVLPEYCFTGSLVLDHEADISKWAVESDLAKKKLKIPDGKVLLANSLVKIDDEIYNCSEFLPTDKRQIKVFPDDTEKMRGIREGKEHGIFNMFNKKFKVLICTDLRYWRDIEIDDAEFILFIYHFTNGHYEDTMKKLKELVNQRKVPVLVSSLVSDKNNGFSTYMNKDIIISMPDSEGILEVEL